MGLNLNKDYSLFSFVLIGATLIGSFWLAINDVKAGSIYFYLMLFTITMIMLIMIFIREDRKEYNLRFPIETSSLRASLKFFLGILIPLLFIFIFPKALNMMNPMMTFNLGANSYAAVQQIDKPFWQMFTIGPTAGVLEEFWAMGMWLFGMITGYYIVRRLGLQNKFAILGMQVVTATIITGGLFSVLHTLNPTYTTTAMFISALVFRIIMSFIMFFILGIEFTIGYHIMNNLIYLGWGTVSKALVTAGGIALIVIILLEIYNLIRQAKKSGEALGEITDIKFPQADGGGL